MPDVVRSLSGIIRYGAGAFYGAQYAVGKLTGSLRHPLLV